MNLDETKKYIESRLNALGWEVRIDRTGYQKIQQYTNGAEDRLSQLYYKLVTIGGRQPKRVIGGDTIEVAIDDLQRMDELVENAPYKLGRSSSADFDRVSIEQLASTLEAKLADDARAAVEETTKREAAAEKAHTSRGKISRTAGKGAKADQAAAALPKILVVDDSPTIRAAVTKALEGYFQFVEASDGEEAWKLLMDDTDIQLVVTDLMMPRLDGYDLIKRIRADKSHVRLSTMAVIVVTALEDTQAKLRALVTGANDFITKTTDTLELRTRVLARYSLAQTMRDLEVKRGNGEPAKPATMSPSPPPRATSTPPRVVAAAPMSSIARESQRLNGTNAKADVRASVAAKAEAPKPVEQPGWGKLQQVVKVTGGALGPQVNQLRSAVGAAHQVLLRLGPTAVITLSATLLVGVVIIAISVANRSQPRTAVPPPDIVTPSVADREAPPSQREPASFAGTRQDDTVSQGTAAREESKLLGLRPKPAEVAPNGERVPAGLARNGAVTNNTSAAVRGSAPVPDRAGRQPRPEAADVEAQPEREQPAVPAAPVVPATQAAAVALADPPRTATSAAPVAEPAPPAHPVALAERKRTEPNPAAAVAPPPSPNKVTQPELSSLLRKFVSVYEAGDIDAFLTLFDDDVRTNDRFSKAGLREDYEGLFKSTTMRQMVLSAVTWEVTDRQATGWGNFEVRVRNVGDEDTKIYKGSLTFHIEKTDGRLRIKRLYHGQWKAGSG